ncbi:uncharacterized protein A4U43_C10F12810 [Asparagus officinalis]|uniref:Uncharacterized protein n=1 Tax=Asparagus officinalis TaxID=4686 RepID=A0A5P1E707_ASPOF|nr:uncharacterized protein A4U43_C10F12810 [Asparagus officinalis]
MRQYLIGSSGVGPPPPKPSELLGSKGDSGARDIRLDGAAVETAEREKEEVKVVEEVEEVVFDSGRTTMMDRLFLDFDGEDKEDAAEEGFNFSFSIIKPWEPRQLVEAPVVVGYFGDLR